MTFHEEIAARTVWMEARNQGARGMLAVAWVLINRLNAQKWFSGQNLTEICLKPLQFSCWNTNDPNRIAMSQAHDQDKLLNSARNCIQAALNRIGEDPTHGSTHYKTQAAKAGWAKGMTPIAVIGDHEFYNNVA